MCLFNELDEGPNMYRIGEVSENSIDTSIIEIIFFILFLARIQVWILIRDLPTAGRPATPISSIHINLLPTLIYQSSNF